MKQLIGGTRGKIAVVVAIAVVAVGLLEVFGRREPAPVQGAAGEKVEPVPGVKPGAAGDAGSGQAATLDEEAQPATREPGRPAQSVLETTVRQLSDAERRRRHISRLAAATPENVLDLHSEESKRLSQLYRRLEQRLKETGRWLERFRNRQRQAKVFEQRLYELYLEGSLTDEQSKNVFSQMVSVEWDTLSAIKIIDGVLIEVIDGSRASTV